MNICTNYSSFQFTVHKLQFIWMPNTRSQLHKEHWQCTYFCDLNIILPSGVKTVGHFWAHLYRKQNNASHTAEMVNHVIFMIAPCVKGIKYFYRSNWCTLIQNRRYINTLKTVTFTPICFGSRRNHRQGAILCLAKTTNVVSLLCSSL